jgi:nucleoside-diphosphate-sugar epimerase
MGPETDESVPIYDRGARRNAAVLITGAGGEVGHGLIRALRQMGRRDLVSIDIHELDPEIKALCMNAYTGDICDGALLGRLLATYEITEIYHLAALLSTRGEFTPETAHEVNVGGTLGLLRLAAEQARSHGRVVRFVFPSSIAAYGIPDLATKHSAGALREDQFLRPTTMYGCNKLACENLGRYYAQHYRQLAKDRVLNILDFRCLRFPGLISADTLPSGGTSDYASEMVHAAALGRPYACFVREDTRIPFLTMPDAIEALMALAAADQAKLSRCVYNLGGFNPSAGEIAALVSEFFPEAQITFEPDDQRQAIVDSWPEDVDDTALHRDLGTERKHALQSAFSEYIVPRIRARYER